MDPYSILEVEQTADEKTIKKAFRRKAVLLHPDTNPNQSEAEAQAFKDLVLAYEVLSDPQKRADYDNGDLNLSDHDFTIRPEEIGLEDLLTTLFQPREGAKKDDLFDFSALFPNRRRKKKPSPAYQGKRVKARIPAVAAENGATISINIANLGLGEDSVKVKVPADTKHGQLLRIKVNRVEVIIEILIED